MDPENPFQPRPVARVETRFRRIVTDLPAPKSIPVLEKLARNELRAMGGQPLVVWDRAEGFRCMTPVAIAGSTSRAAS